GCEATPGGRSKTHIWWRVGRIATVIPSGASSWGAHRPAQFTTTGASIGPALVVTPQTRSPSTRIVSARPPRTSAAPSSRARAARREGGGGAPGGVVAGHASPGREPHVAIRDPGPGRRHHARGEERPPRAGGMGAVCVAGEVPGLVGGGGDEVAGLPIPGVPA